MNKAHACSDGKIFRRVPRRCRRNVNSSQLCALSGESSEIPVIGGCESKRRISTDSKRKVTTRKVIISKNRGEKIVVMFVNGSSAAILYTVGYIYVGAANQ